MKHLILLFPFVFFISATHSNAQQKNVANINSAAIRTGGPEPNNNSHNNNPTYADNYAIRNEPVYKTPLVHTTNYSAANTYNKSNFTASRTTARNIPATNNRNSSYAARHNYTHVVCRYNYVAGSSYPYCPSTKVNCKKNKEHCDSLAKIAPPFKGNPILYDSQVYYYTNVNLQQSIMWSDENFAYNEYYNPNSSAFNVSLDGYVVYNDDTLTGIITMTKNAIFFERPTNTKSEYGYRFSYKDKSLKSVILYNGNNEELYLTRPTDDNEKLLRVLHNGKLSIYDYCYSFPDKYNIDKGHMAVAYGGRLKPLGSFISLDMRYPLVKAVNKVYGTDLQISDYTWNELLRYVNRLD